MNFNVIVSSLHWFLPIHTKYKLSILPKSTITIILQLNRTLFNTYIVEEDFRTKVQLAIQEVLAPILDFVHMYLKKYSPSSTQRVFLI